MSEVKLNLSLDEYSLLCEFLTELKVIYDCKINHNIGSLFTTNIEKQKEEYKNLIDLRSNIRNQFFSN